MADRAMEEATSRRTKPATAKEREDCKSQTRAGTSPRNAALMSHQPPTGEKPLKYHRSQQRMGRKWLHGLRDGRGETPKRKFEEHA